MKVKDILDKKVKRGIESLERKGFLENVAKTAKDSIRKRTRLGYGVESPGSKKTRLKSLDPDYKKQRKKLKKKGVLSTQTTPAKSNLTKTGKMVNSVKSTVEGKTPVVYIDPEQAGKVQGNADLGRKFLNLSDLELKEIKDIIIKRLKLVARK